MKKQLLFLLLFTPFLSIGQQALKEANSLHDKAIFLEAATKYQEYLAMAKKIEPQTWLNVADTYYNLDNIERAKIAYDSAYTKLSYDFPAKQFWQYCDALRFQKNYEKADELYIGFLKSKDQNEAVENYQNEKMAFDEIKDKTTDFEVKNLDFNSEYSDFGGGFNEKDFVFSSARNRNGDKIYNRDNTPFLSLFKITDFTLGKNSKVELFNTDLETEYHDATATFAPKSLYFYYASSYQAGKRQIFTGKKENFFKIYRVKTFDVPFKKEVLAFNGDTFSTGQPFITEDGKHLYFSSDMPGGYGAVDIYVCDVHDDGTFSVPKNLGPEINTPYDDFFPYLQDNIFYFASNGHVGFGGLDIYKANLKDGFFETPVNLGSGINSTADDFAYFAGKMANTGYFSSNRAGGKGSDDIYSFVYNCQMQVSGHVYAGETQNVLANASVSIINDAEEEFATTQTDAQGAYTIAVACADNLSITAKKMGFATLSKPLKSNENKATVDFNLQERSDVFTVINGVEKIRIDPIFFEYQRYDINPFAAQQLKKVIDVMGEFPKMIIEIAAYTDQRGSEEYNQNLSQKRAISTRDFLIKSGIAKTRIASAKGYGESNPINDCDAVGKKCSEAEYLENRRSEFTVIKR